jgi:hypothetical protein
LVIHLQHRLAGDHAQLAGTLRASKNHVQPVLPAKLAHRRRACRIARDAHRAHLQSLAERFGFLRGASLRRVVDLPQPLGQHDG